MLDRYGGAAGPDRPRTGGLTPRQLARAKELMRSRLGSDVSLTELANECRLSASHFARAFRQSTGVPPHRWLQQRRIERAMAMLRNGERTLAEVACECGFADQSHFTRVFSRSVGTSPGRWRRMQS